MIIIKRVRKDHYTQEFQKITYTYFLFSAIPIYRIIQYYDMNVKRDDNTIIETMQGMCEESLSPDIFEKWEAVKHWLIQNRKGLK